MRGSRFAAGTGTWVGQAIDAAALHGVEAYSDLPGEAVEALMRLSRELWPELEEVDRDHGRLLARGVSALCDAGDDVDEASLRVAAELVDEMALTEAQREAVLAYGVARTIADGFLDLLWNRGRRLDTIAPGRLGDAIAEVFSRRTGGALDAERGAGP